MAGIIIERIAEGAFGETEYAFFREDDYGELWELGRATRRIQDEGTEDEMIWWDGRFDTREISFDDEDDLKRVIKRRSPNDDVFIYDSEYVAELRNELRE